jgi:hypothetical protein
MLSDVVIANVTKRLTNSIATEKAKMDYAQSANNVTA